MSIFDDVFSNDPLSYNSDRIYSVMTGIVKENWNSDYPGMVKVEMYLGESGKNLTGWVPVMTPYAGTEFGSYTLPELDSEVVIAFILGDRNCPVVIGSLWNKVNTLMPETAVENNYVKRFKTKGGCEVIFNDESDKQKIEIKTPGGIDILLDDENKAFSILDKDSKNSFSVASQDGAIEISADKKIVLKVGGAEAVSIDGSAKEISLKLDKITVEAGQTLGLKGQTTNLEGSQVKISGSSQTEVSSSGQTAVKGSIVQIN